MDDSICAFDAILDVLHQYRMTAPGCETRMLKRQSGRIPHECDDFMASVKGVRDYEPPGAASGTKDF